MASTVTGIPATVNLLVYQGDDLYLDLAVTNKGAPADLTGFTAKSEIRATQPSTTVLAELTTSIVGSTVSLHLLHSDAALLAGSAVWDCQLTDSSGNITTIAAGTVTVTPEVTRP